MSTTKKSQDAVVSKALKEALDAMVLDSVSDQDPAKAVAIAKATREAVEIDGRRRYYKLRENWSSCIIIWISVLIVFNCTLAILVGLGTLDFTNYQWFITAVSVETFLQIVGMGLVAVKFLFNDIKQ